MRWLTNITDPSRNSLYHYFDDNDPTGEYRRQWLADKIKGRSKSKRHLYR